MGALYQLVQANHCAGHTLSYSMHVYYKNCLLIDREDNNAYIAIRLPGILTPNLLPFRCPRRDASIAPASIYRLEIYSPRRRLYADYITLPLF